MSERPITWHQKCALHDLMAWGGSVRGAVRNRRIANALVAKGLVTIADDCIVITDKGRAAAEAFDASAVRLDQP